GCCNPDVPGYAGSTFQRLVSVPRGTVSALVPALVVNMNPVPVSLPFADRSEAGHRLAERVRPFAITEPLVLALPRGGVPVGVELAQRLDADLDVLMVRKIGLPGRPEAGVGAIAEDGHIFYDDVFLAQMRLPPNVTNSSAGAARIAVSGRCRRWRDGTASSSTTAWPREVLRVPRCGWCARQAPPNWCSPFRSLPQEPWRHCVRRSTPWWYSVLRTILGPWGRGTALSIRTTTVVSPRSSPRTF